MWYASGTAGDSVWRGSGGGTTSTGVILRNEFTALVGSFDGTARVDVFWYAPGSVSDGLWFR